MNAFQRIAGLLVLVPAFLGLSAQAALAQADAVAPHAPNANPIVNVAHFAPFGSTVADTSVTVRVNGTDVITEFVYPKL